MNSPSYVHPTIFHTLILFLGYSLLSFNCILVSSIQFFNPLLIATWSRQGLNLPHSFGFICLFKNLCLENGCVLLGSYLEHEVIRLSSFLSLTHTQYCQKYTVYISSFHITIWGHVMLYPIIFPHVKTKFWFSLSKSNSQIFLIIIFSTPYPV